MKTVNVKARITYDYQMEIPDNEKERAIANIVYYCGGFDPVHSAMCKLMETRGVQWEGQLISIVDEDTDEVRWDGE